jgi:hypothetical protein
LYAMVKPESWAPADEMLANGKVCATTFRRSEVAFDCRLPRGRQNSGICRSAGWRFSSPRKRARQWRPCSEFWSFSRCLGCQSRPNEGRYGRLILYCRCWFRRPIAGLQNTAILRLNLTPHCSRGLADAIFGHELARHRGQHYRRLHRAIVGLPD